MSIVSTQSLNHWPLAASPVSVFFKNTRHYAGSNRFLRSEEQVVNHSPFAVEHRHWFRYVGKARCRLQPFPMCPSNSGIGIINLHFQPEQVPLGIIGHLSPGLVTPKSIHASYLLCSNIVRVSPKNVSVHVGHGKIQK